MAGGAAASEVGATAPARWASLDAQLQRSSLLPCLRPHQPPMPQGGDAADGEGDEDFGPVLDGDVVERILADKGTTLPLDMAEAARTIGLPTLLLSRYCELQGAAWPLSPAIRTNALLRNRMLADPSFLFKVATEVLIDSGCATFAEYQKRGEDFWNEFEFYMADLLVGIALDVALVGMLAPIVRFGAPPSNSSRGLRARLARSLAALPNSIFEAPSPGRRFTLGQRTATYFVKAGQYGASGFGCGIVGQGIANSIMILKRRLRKEDEEHGKDVKVPNLLGSAALWGVFMAFSSNTRYQVINGLERVVEKSVARTAPQAALAFTVAIRFANNIYGGMQFVDWARWTGVQ
eukprot:SM000369S13626  [mRNA]  locus=s369:66208:68462:+ [translate_table: standard]